ncbi:ELMO domain-containing protein [Acrasis kona]|uniref:ELMO domain-containing protein n=1 Tax=Acrasis kona TaxID=1008807 RepID=A0AAW2YTI5_9EUKA
MYRETVHNDPRWPEVGFQGSNPSTDFRGMGLLSLTSLLYIAQVHSDKAIRMTTRTYPLCCTIINITNYVMSKLSKPGPKNTGSVVDNKSPMLKLMEGEMKSVDFQKRCLVNNQAFLFEEMLWMVTELFDAIWTTRQEGWDISELKNNETAHYFKFGEVFKETKSVVNATLDKHPPHYGTFKYLLNFDGLYDYNK